MTTRYFTERDVIELIDMRTAVAAVADAFRHLVQGEAHNVPRHRARGKGIMLHTMSAAADYLGLVGWKCYTTTAAGARFLVGLYEQSTGELVALIEADHLGRLRTGATTGVAIRCLTHAGEHTVGLFGAGKQAESQLAAVAAVRSIREVHVYSRDVMRRIEFAERMSRTLNLRVLPANEPHAAVEHKSIVITATTAKSPVLDGAWLAPGAFVAAVGSNALNRAEIDVETVRRAGLVVCDSVAACRPEAGDFVPAIEQDVFDWAKALDLSGIVAAGPPPRLDRQAIILFKSVGLAIEDVALGAELLRRAIPRDRGIVLPLQPEGLPVG